jgi:hypothetical protein
MQVPKDKSKKVAGTLRPRRSLLEDFLLPIAFCYIFFFGAAALAGAAGLSV